MEEPNYTELLEKEHFPDPMAARLIEKWRKEGSSDKEIYETLESFY